MLLGWFIGMLVDWFVMMPRAGRLAREQNVRWLKSKDSEPLWGRVAERTVGPVRKDLMAVEGRVVAQVVRLKQEVAEALTKDLQVLRDEVHEHIEEVRSEQMSAMGRYGAVMKKKQQAAHELAEATIKEMGEEAEQALSPEEMFMLELADIPDDPDMNPVTRAGVKHIKRIVGRALAARGNVGRGGTTSSNSPVA